MHRIEQGRTWGCPELLQLYPAWLSIEDAGNCNHDAISSTLVATASGSLNYLMIVFRSDGKQVWRNRSQARTPEEPGISLVASKYSEYLLLH
jgi:hypothetical protein